MIFFANPPDSNFLLLDLEPDLYTALQRIAEAGKKLLRILFGPEQEQVAGVMNERQDARQEIKQQRGAGLNETGGKGS